MDALPSQSYPEQDCSERCYCRCVVKTVRIKPDSGQCALCRAPDKAHVRRYFEEARKAHSANNATGGYARRALEFIRELYLVERALWDRDHPVSPEDRIRVRTELSTAVMNEFHTWLEALAPNVLPQSLLGKAVHYALGQWRKLSVFLAHGEVPLDNNRCENAIRPFVTERSLCTS
jgi:transposase